MTPIRTIGKIGFLLLLVTQINAQSNLEFIENKGQWEQQIRFKGDLNNGAFLLQNTGYRMVLYDKNDMDRIRESIHHSTASKEDRATFVQKDGKATIEGFKGTEQVLRGHIYEMRLLNANKNPTILPDKPLATYSNYFIGNDSTKWASNCRTFQGVTYQNVYPQIDVRYYSSQGVLKYDFIVHPGGDPSNIAMYFDGADNVRLKDGALKIKTSVEEITEMAPYTYQLNDIGRTEVPCYYEVKGSIVRFKFEGNYSKNATLVIDPQLIFSTFTGSRADNWGYTATYDGKGNFYSGGIVFGNPANGFPTNNGAFQQAFQGGTNTGEGQSNGFDMGIMKFDPSGSNRIYATYIGGTKGNEQPHSLIVDAAGNLIIAGRTTSSDYPTAGALKTYGPLGGSGIWDIVITKLNVAGTGLIGSVKIGGGGDDGVNIRHKYPYKGPISINLNYGDDARSEVIVDPAGNIYYASCTQSPNFPTTSVSGQTSLGGINADNRSQDAVILKLSTDLSSVLFSVIVGGNDDDAAFVLSINPITGNLFVAGATASNNFPGNKTGVKYPNFQGGTCDGFVAEYTPTGTLVRSGFFGTNGNDIIYGIQFDKFGFPYISGTTTGNWPVVNAAFSQAAGKQFIAKLQPDLSDFVYSTVFGSGAATPNLSPTAFLVDRCENVYFSGWGGGINNLESPAYPNSGTKGLSVTADAYQPTTDGMDLYFFVLEKNATKQLYGSYFGQTGGFGEHVDGGTSRFDRNGVIYQSICANCGSQKAQFPTTPGVWSPFNGAQDCNLAAVKMAFNLAGIGAGVLASVSGVPHDTTGCIPMMVDFSDTLAMGKKYIWDFNDGSPAVTTLAPSVTHTFNSVGFYRVKLIAIDSSSCNIADTSFVNMRVRDDKAGLAFTTAKLPPCASLSYQFTNTSVSVKPFQNNSFRWDFGDGATQLGGLGPVTHTYAAPGTYNVKLVLIDTNYCNEPDSLVKQIRLAANVKAQFVTPPTGCVPYDAIFNNTSLGGSQFLWDFGDGFTSTLDNPTHLYSSIGSYKVRLIATDTATCNKVDTSAFFTITVSPIPISNYSYSPNPTQTNEPVVFTNAAIGGTIFKWVYGDGDTLMTVRTDTLVSHLYNSSGTFNTCLIAYNNSGCSDTACQSIAVTITPVLDVPNAFTPNGDGVNDKIFARGFGIEKMTFRIYNRWGLLMYEGTDPNQGWDGTYNGRLQPQDVYHYTLVVQFSSKEKATKKGDITLLR